MGHLDKPSTPPTEVFVIGGNFVFVCLLVLKVTAEGKKNTTHLSLGLIL